MITVKRKFSIYLSGRMKTRRNERKRDLEANKKINKE